NHFNTRLDLLTATVEYALAELREGFAQAFSVVGADASATELLSILWDCMKRPEQVAITEVFALARTNSELREALTPIVQEHHRSIKDMVDVMAEVQVEAANARADVEVARRADRTGSNGGAAGGHGITAEFVESISFLYIYAMVGLTINNATGAGLGGEAEFVRLGQQIFNAVELQGGGG
ncbi:MAG: hypothetical protein OER95_06190, partial [Acidimicrobiia bacterium]|nr:hypothetical protein [Acidimicrobiia bacterium]